MINERWVVNASPVIVLARIGQAGLLSALAQQVVMPEAVANEILAGPPDDPACLAVQQGKFAIVKAPPPHETLLAWDLGLGETSVLALAIAEPGTTAILDDAAARRCARSFSVPVKGTLAVIILAKQNGLIASAAELLRALKTSGFRINDTLVEKALQQTVNETWSGHS